MPDRNAVEKWEFLESKNTELSAKLGVPARTLKLKTEGEHGTKNLESGAISFNPAMIGFLDEGEATFMVAHALVGRRMTEQIYPGGRLPFRIKHTRLHMLLVSEGAALATIAFAWFTVPDPHMWPLAVLVLAMPLAMMAWLPFRMRRIKKNIMKYRPRFDMSPMARGLFNEAISLTGDPAAGERYMRKSATLTVTEFGKKPRMTDETRERGKYMYTTNVPPEYQTTADWLATPSLY